MKSEQIAAQLYSFREFTKTREDLCKTLHRLRQIGYDAVQLFGSVMSILPETELRKILDGEGMKIISAHENSDAIVNETDRVVERLLKLDCRHVAYPFPHIPLTGLQAACQIAETLQSISLRMKRSGVTLAYHNHDVEFVRFDGRLALDLIFEKAPALQGEIDTFWVQSGGASPLDWIRRMYRRMDTLHIKDFAITDGTKTRAGVMAPIGDGNLEWFSLIAAAEEGGVKHFVVEHDGNCGDPFTSFARSMAYLKHRFVR